MSRASSLITPLDSDFPKRRRTGAREVAHAKLLVQVRTRLRKVEVRMQRMQWLGRQGHQLLVQLEHGRRKSVATLSIPYGLFVVFFGIRLSRSVLFMYAFSKHGAVKISHELLRLRDKFRVVVKDIQNEIDLAQCMIARLEAPDVSDSSKPHTDSSRAWKTALLSHVGPTVRRRPSLLPLDRADLYKQLEVLFQRTSLFTTTMRFLNPEEIQALGRLFVDAVIGSMYSACSAQFLALAFGESNMGLFKAAFSISHFIRRALFFAFQQLLNMIDEKQNVVAEDNPTTHPYSQVLSYKRQWIHFAVSAITSAMGVYAAWHLWPYAYLIGTSLIGARIAATASNRVIASCFGVEKSMSPIHLFWLQLSLAACGIDYNVRLNRVRPGLASGVKGFLESLIAFGHFGFLENIIVKNRPYIEYLRWNA